MLSERVRSGSEAAPWVVDGIKQLEAENERLREALKEMDKAIETWFAKKSPIKDALQDFIKEALQQKESE